MPSLVLAGLLAASLIGAADALFFVLVDRGRLAPDPRWLPAVCRMDEATCATIIDRPEARLFGLANATYGLAWYLSLAALSVHTLVTGQGLVGKWVWVAAAGLVVLVSAYLVYVLSVKLEANCQLCYLAHGLNGAILALLALAP